MNTRNFATSKPMYWLLIIFFITFFITVSETAAQDRAVAPIYQNGDCWIFNATSKAYQGYTSTALENGEHEICFENGTFLKLGKGEKYKVAGVWVGLLHMGVADRNKFLDHFPLIVGKKWTVDYVTEVRGTNRRERRKAETQVVAMEEVFTKVGTLRTFKIDRGLWWDGYLTGRYTYYWSPETKSVIKYDYEALIGSTATRQIELIKFNFPN